MDYTRVVGKYPAAETVPVHLLNIAATCSATRALGPGLRAVVWVQGCNLHCPGCIAPNWIPMRPARLVSPEKLVDELLADPRINGLTFSGGEPMLQASALAWLAQTARSRRELNIICFTGYQRQQLQNNPPGPGVMDLLSQVDVLIDGPYIAGKNDNIGLRGSSNQGIHHLTGRLLHENLEHLPRRAEIQVLDGEALLVGVPPVHLAEAYNTAVDRASTLTMRLVSYERL